MKSMGDQFYDKIRGIVGSRSGRMSLKVADKVGESMKKNVDSGRAFNGRSFTSYAPRTRADRRRLGLSGSPKPVTFQRFTRRIKAYQTERFSGGARLHWRGLTGRRAYSFGQILYFHQHGIGKNPKRKILPETTNEIPQQFHRDIAKQLRPILDERFSK